MEYGKRIKELRVYHSLSQFTLAAELQVAQNTLSNWENGYREPSLEMLESIADYFNVDMNFLVGQTTYSEYLETKKSPAADEGDEDVDPRKRKLIDQVLVSDDAELEAIERIVDSVLALRDK